MNATIFRRGKNLIPYTGDKKNNRKRNPTSLSTVIIYSSGSNRSSGGSNRSSGSSVSIFKLLFNFPNLL